MPLLADIDVFHMHNPRCAGSAINKALYKAQLLKLKSLRPQVLDVENFYGNGRIDGQHLELDHLSISQVIARMTVNQIHNLHFFSIVRHPLDRFISDFLRKKNRNDERYISASNVTLSEYLEAFLEKVSTKPESFNNQFNAAHFWPQSWFADFNAHPDIRKSSILKFEDLESEWKHFQSLLKFNAPLPAVKVNASKPDNEGYRTQYFIKTDLYKAFKKFYHRDYIAFGYN